MANCDVSNLSAQELRNLIKNKQLIYETQTEQEAEVTYKFFKHTAEKFGVIENESDRGYGLIEIGEIDLTESVTEPVSKLFKKRKGLLEAERISNLPDNQIKQKGGIKIHAVNERIGKALVLKTETLDKVYEDFGDVLTPDQFNALVSGVKEVLTTIYTEQARINKQNGTNGKVKIMFEQVVVDPLNDRGGTIDLLALYSDNSASIFDYKAIMPQSSRVSGTGVDAVVIEEIFPEYKKEGFNMQMAEYKRICMDRYGVTKFRHSRIVPVHVQYKIKPPNSRQSGASLEDRIMKIEMGRKASEFLDQLPSGFEDTGDPRLNELIKKQMGIIENLKKRAKSKGLKEGEWAKIQERIKFMTKAVNTLIMRQDVNVLLAHVASLRKEFHQRIEQPEYLEDGTKNPLFLEKKELDQMHDEFQVYADLIRYTKNLIKQKKKDLNPGAYEKFLDFIARASGKITLTLDDMQEAKNLRWQDNLDPKHFDEYGRLKPQRSLGFFTQIFSRESEIRHPIFKAFVKLKDKALFKTRSKLNEVMDELEEKRSALFRWAKDNNMSKKKAYEMLINPETGNMVARTKKEFWQKRQEAKDNNNHQWFKDNYELRDKARWQKQYKENKENFSEFLKGQLNYNFATNSFEDMIVDGKTEKSAKQYAAIYKSRMEAWERDNNLEKSDFAWSNGKNTWAMKMKPEVYEANLSDEYKRIRDIKPLHDFYEMWERRMIEFRDILGLNYDQMGANFIPNIRKSIYEKFEGKNFNPGDSIKEMIDSLGVRQEDIYIANQDIVTGARHKQVPVLFVSPFRDADGNISVKEKSFDLSSSLILFAKMAYNHKYMSEIESTTVAMKDFLGSADYQEYVEDSKGRKTKDVTGNWATRIMDKLGIANSTQKTFAKFVDYHLYGIRFQEEGVLGQGKTVNFFGKDINSTKAVLTAKNYFATKILGFAIIPGVAAWTAGQTGVFLQGTKGVAFSTKHQWNARKYKYSQRSKFYGLNKFFDVYAEDHTYRKGLKLTRSNVQRFANMRTMFAPLRKADEDIDNITLVSMTQNYGIDSEGNVRRLANLPEGTKSIWDRTTITKDGGIEIEGINDEAFIQFRNAVRYVAGGIKGSMNGEDVSAAHMSLALDAAMQFKTWMPGFLTERFGRTHYNETIDAVQMGRYRALHGNFRYDKDDNFGTYLRDVVAPNLGKIAFDLATFGLGPVAGLKRVNETRARLEFNSWRLENPDAENVSFEDFVDAKQRQIRAMMAEMRIMLLMAAMITFLASSAGDDDEPRYAKYWASRVLFKTFNRAQSEIAFAYTPSEFTRLISNPIPMSRLFLDVQRTIYNTFDETRDAIWGENSPQDNTPWLYQGSQWIPGMSQFRRVFEIFEQDKRNDYR